MMPSFSSKGNIAALLCFAVLTALLIINLAFYLNPAVIQEAGWLAWFIVLVLYIAAASLIFGSMVSGRRLTPGSVAILVGLGVVIASPLLLLAKYILAPP